MKVYNKVYENENKYMKREIDFDETYHYIWSDRWHLEGNKAWFVAGTLDVLFCLDLDTRKTVLVAKIPMENVRVFRGHPRCVKAGNLIFCLPDCLHGIWCYNLSDGAWTYIYVDNPAGARISCNNVWHIDGRLYIVSLGLKKIIELDIETKRINDYYGLPVGEGRALVGGILAGNCIYTAGTAPACICEFDCIDKTTRIYELPGVGDVIGTICFDGDKFWLGARRKKIYVWDKEKDNLNVIEGFPKSFGIWNFDGRYKQLLNCQEEVCDTSLFISVVPVGQFVWFIPFKTNEILYVDKDTFEIQVFDIDGEYHTENDMEVPLHHKYLVEYIRDNRYIGIFSLKNKWMFEIDCLMLKYEVLDYRLDDINDRINACIIMESKDNILHEHESSDWKFWMKYLVKPGSKSGRAGESAHVGRDIYNKLGDI